MCTDTDVTLYSFTILLQALNLQIFKSDTFDLLMPFKRFYDVIKTFKKVKKKKRVHL